MRSRAVLTLIIVVLAVIGAGLYALVRPTGAESRPVAGPEETATAYLAAWEGSDIGAMSRLVADTPADFAERHLAFSRDLDIESLDLIPGTLRRHGGQVAELPFQGVRGIRDLGAWPFASTLRLVRRDGRWKVLWTPETLHPALKDGGRIRLKEVPGPAVELVTRSGTRFPRDSGAESYLGMLGADLEGDGSGYALEAVRTDGTARELMAFAPPSARRIRTTFSRPVQAAAARALDGVDSPAAIVAIKADTGEVLALADRLGGELGGQGAIRGLYPPGSTFKVVTAAALLSRGMAPDSRVSCPAAYTPPNGRPFVNAGGHAAPGTTTLTGAFAVSCNTTFAERSVRLLSAGGLVDAAELFGFNKDIEGPGVCGTVKPHGSADELGADAIGQNSVVASPLCMALVAAAVQDGSWHQPIMTGRRGKGGRGTALPPDVVTGLRAMMRAVVATGTASSAGFPPGTAGKTGTAEVSGGREHAWFIGYHGKVAFAVLVKNGGSGAKAAVPIASRFLRAL
ncbi:penicillin-binding transpeptidase domain-containing protein [Streptosporangium canum]|uniref:penicillin-binding transpeptidase domain-containing protein n=1 Tax=Streptosporangium canum TaxID=324952 RepID=UPI00379B5D9F